MTNAPAEYVSLALGALLIAIVATLGYRVWKGSRLTPDELEQRRRAYLAVYGKMGDATLVELRGDNLFYSYMVGGVEYTACQEVSSLRERLPRDIYMDGSVSVKYDPRNPANSIVLAEQWSGLRK